MGDITNIFLNYKELEQEMQRLFSETKTAMERYIDAAALILVKIVQNKFAEFAQDHSVIYHACLRYLSENSKLHPIHYLKPTDPDEFAMMHCMRQMCGLVPGAESSHFEHHVLKAFGGTEPATSDRLADALNSLHEVISRSNGYSSERRRCVRFYVVHLYKIYPLCAKDKKLLDHHKDILFAAYGTVINKHPSMSEWKQSRGIAQKNKK